MSPMPPPPPDNTKKQIELFAEKLEKLRLSFEQYFLGFEKMAPLKQRNEVQNLLRNLSASPIKNTALKFRYDQLVARHNAMNQYWSRVLREIEDGTYQRDLFKLKIHEQESPEKAGGAGRGAAAGLAERLKSLPADGLSAVVKQYLTAREQAGEDLSKVDPAKVRESIKKQAEKIAQQYQCKSVSFRIAKEAGKVILKAVPKT
jgi:hypothetical protein